MWFTDGAIRLTQFHCALTQHTQPETPNLILPLDAPKCHYNQTCLNQRPCFDGTGTAPCELTERSTVVWVEKEPATSLATSGPFNGHKTQSFTAGKTIHHLQQTYRAWTNSISHPSKLQFQPVILRPNKIFRRFVVHEFGPSEPSSSGCGDPSLAPGSSRAARLGS